MPARPNTQKEGAAGLCRSNGAEKQKARKIDAMQKIATKSRCDKPKLRLVVTSRSVSTARARVVAWAPVLDAVAEQRDALQHRIWRGDPDDTLLEADCQTFCELSNALADFLQARRAA